MTLILFLSCGKEDADPWDYLGPEKQKSNFVELAENTLMISSEESKMIMDVKTDELLFDSKFTKELKVGDIIVNTGQNQDKPVAFYRKVINVSKAANGSVQVKTKEASLTDAYKRYYIDSDFDKTYIQTRTRRFSEYFQSEGTGFANTVGFSIIPNFSTEFDADSIRFVSSYNLSANSTSNTFSPPAFRLEVKGLRLLNSVSFTFTGRLESGYEAKFASIALLPLPSVGLCIYLTPKAELTASIEASVSTPTITFSALGSYDLIFDYNVIQGVKEASFIPSSTLTTPTVSGAWVFSGEGSLAAEFGVELHVSILGAADAGKCGAFIYGYVNPSIQKAGNFINLTSGFDLNVMAGIGIKFFAELPFFTSEPNPNTSDWPDFNLFMESPPFNDVLFDSIIAGVSICTFSQASAEVTSSQLIVSAAKSTGVGYQVLINDALYNGGEVFPYGQTSFLGISQLTLPVNKLAVKDAIVQNCNISTNVVRPDFIVGDCDGTVLDPAGNEYCTKRIGDLIWMVENYRFAGTSANPIGRPYNNEVDVYDKIFGRLYTFTEIMNGYDFRTSDGFKVQGICPSGWYIPSAAEYANLASAIGGAANFGKNAKLKNSILWPNAQLPQNNTFSAVSGGEYYSWASPSERFGERFKKGFYWTSSFTQDQNFSNPNVRVIEIDKAINISTVGSVGPQYLRKSILEMGYSCRCVKDL